jgi:hypothetical protein
MSAMGLFGTQVGDKSRIRMLRDKIVTITNRDSERAIGSRRQSAYICV